MHNAHPAPIAPVLFRDDMGEHGPLPRDICAPTRRPLLPRPNFRARQLLGLRRTNSAPWARPVAYDSDERAETKVPRVAPVPLILNNVVKAGHPIDATSRAKAERRLAAEVSVSKSIPRWPVPTSEIALGRCRTDDGGSVAGGITTG